MQIEVRLYATLRKYTPNNVGGIIQIEWTEKMRAADVLVYLAIPREEVKLVMVNGIAQDFAHSIVAGDRIGLFPPIGGG